MDQEFISDAKNPRKIKWTPFLRQIQMFFTLCSLYFVSGLFLGTPTVARAHLSRDNSTAVSDSMISWINSVNGLSSPIHILILSYPAHYYGRKKALHFIAMLMIAASTLVFFSYNAVHILVSQLMYGNLLTASMTILPMILSECSSIKYRGLFYTLKSATLFWGIWIANAIGIFTHFKYIGLLGIVISTYAFVNSFILPESPYWLASHGKYEESMLTHRLLKGNSDETEKELHDLLSMQKQRGRKETSKKSIRSLIQKYFKIMKLPEVRKPLALSILVFLLYDFSGKLICAIYAVELMRQLTSSQTETYVAVLILDGITIVGMYIGCVTSRFLKRRTMLLVNSSISVIFLFMISLYLYLVKLAVLPQNSYIITVLLIGYSLAVCCGPMILSLTIFGELIPMKARNFCVCFCCVIYYVLSRTIAKLSLLMFSYFGIHGTFLMFGISCSVCLILVYKYLPETKGKSLYEIAALFVNKTEENADITILETSGTPMLIARK
ncbi:facilitated trehalose transporter Tret1-2 homolog [Ostrinia furnacalis]|uniref:facilitated trehalose transporter Tret1-2 homolog n=1 Tax=Ostrinia furnacalis TaxID=93504 RepID=UPI00103F33A0|nr:facilitated trehalose transporter Tret1-2 homolog [Ostrinia furnacalis]